jgi:hypothetical protein
MNAIRRMVAVVAITTIASAVIYAQPQSSQRTGRLRRITLQEGQRVSAALKDGQRVSGTVGTVFSRGFDVHQLDGTLVFVEYRIVATLLDPDTGAIVGTVPDAPMPPREKGALIAIAAVAGLTIATHGMYPVGLLMHFCCS